MFLLPASVARLDMPQIPKFLSAVYHQGSGEFGRRIGVTQVVEWSLE